MPRITVALAAVIAAVGFVIADHALTAEAPIVDVQVISSDANARFLKLGLKKAVVIELPADIKEVLVADQKTVTVVARTIRRIYIIGAAVGETNVFFYDADGRQIVALNICVSEGAELHPPALGKIWHGRRFDRDLSRRFMSALTLPE
jgi:Flp pilus assembly secretin CpaC